jgi:hypothetical protein
MVVVATGLVMVVLWQSGKQRKRMRGRIDRSIDRRDDVVFLMGESQNMARK